MNLCILPDILPVQINNFRYFQAGCLVSGFYKRGDFNSRLDYNLYFILVRLIVDTMKTDKVFGRFAFINLVWLLVIAVGCSQSPDFPIEPEAISPTERKSSATSTATVPALVYTKTPDNSPTPEPDIDLGKLAGERIVLWHTWGGQAGGVVAEIVEDWNKNNQWGVSVEALYQGNPDAINNKILTQENKEDLANLAIAYLHQAHAWDNIWSIEDLNTFIDDPHVGFSKEEQADFYGPLWSSGQVGEKRLGLPVQQFGNVLFYNQSWAQELGFEEPPATPEEFKNQACAATNATLLDESDENNGMGGWVISTDYAATLGWLYAYGAEFYLPGKSGEMDTIYEFNNPQTRDAFRFLRSLYDDGCAFLSAGENHEVEFASRSALFRSGDVSDIPFQDQAFRDANNSDTWILIAYTSPSGPGALDVYGPALVMMSSTPEKQFASWLFLKWFTEPEQQARLIETAGTLPIRESTLDLLNEYRDQNPHWSQAVSLLADAKSEPGTRSWQTVRWALGDATRQLFLYYFTVDDIPGLLEFLDKTAHELFLGPENSGLLDTPTFTPSATLTPSMTPTPGITPTATRTARPTNTNTPEPGRPVTETP